MYNEDPTGELTPDFINVMGMRVVNLMPDYDQRVGALVDFATLQKIVSFMGRGSLAQIVSQHTTKVNNCSTLEEYVEVLEDELAFQKTVNQIRLISPKPNFAEEMIGE